MPKIPEHSNFVKLPPLDDPPTVSSRPATAQTLTGRTSLPATPRQECVVISSMWPGWLAILPNVNYQCTDLCVADPSCPFLRTLLPLHPACKVHPLSNLARLTPPAFCFIQGEAVLCHSLPATWTFSRTLAYLSDSQPPPSTWTTISLSHLHYGGGTMGELVVPGIPWFLPSRTTSNYTASAPSHYGLL
jgi:hypothetical protein